VQLVRRASAGERGRGGVKMDKAETVGQLLEIFACVENTQRRFGLSDELGMGGGRGRGMAGVRGEEWEPSENDVQGVRVIVAQVLAEMAKFRFVPCKGVRMKECACECVYVCVRACVRLPAARPYLLGST